MDDSTGWTWNIGLGLAGYPLYLARILIQLGYEPIPPTADGRLPNIFTYIRFIKEQRGYRAIYTGLSYYIPANIIKKSLNDLYSHETNNKVYNKRFDVSKIIADCFLESALKIYTTILTYPLATLGIGYISATFFGTKETVEFTLEAMYRGLVPKLIFEVTSVWVGIITKRLTVSFVEDEVAQAIICRTPTFLVNSLLYPLNVVSTVMADNGRSRIDPKFHNWSECFYYLRDTHQLKRGSSYFLRSLYRENLKKGGQQKRLSISS